MQHMSVCAFVFVRGCYVTANIFTKRNREVRHWSLQHALYHVHSGPHKVQSTNNESALYKVYGGCMCAGLWCTDGYLKFGNNV